LQGTNWGITSHDVFKALGPELRLDFVPLSVANGMDDEINVVGVAHLLTRKFIRDKQTSCASAHKRDLSEKIRP
jgi:hypothetical protein